MYLIFGLALPEDLDELRSACFPAFFFDLRTGSSASSCSETGLNFRLEAGVLEGEILPRGVLGVLGVLTVLGLGLLAD